MDDQIFSYDHDFRGRPVPGRVWDLMTSPRSLRARAAVREEIARQDERAGALWAAHRNRDVAHHMRLRAALAEQG